jgi:hypothetical protein
MKRKCLTFDSKKCIIGSMVKKTTLPNTAGRKAAQKKYNAKPAQKKRRAQRNKTRRMMERAGLVRKGDKRDIDHKNHNPADQRPGNLRVTSQSFNRSRNRRGK